MQMKNTLIEAESLRQMLELAAEGIGLQVNGNKTEYMCFNQEETFSL